MLPRQLPVLVLVLLLTLSAVMAVFGRDTAFDPVGNITLPKSQEMPQILIGAGDISVCGLGGDKETAELIAQLFKEYPRAEIFTAGDNAQSMGTMEEYNNCFEPAWGRFKQRIHPSPGNHDWYNNHGEGYFAYFGDLAGPKGLGFYSYNLGSWHIVSLNSNCDLADCGPDSQQMRWLREDLETYDSRHAVESYRCTLLYWHHPVWDSGTVPILPGVKALWDTASDYGADVIVNGHDHHYERFAPLGRDGNIDTATGTRPFIVGTGGAWLFDLAHPLDATEARDNTTHGVIMFKLYPGRYTWQFVPVDGGTFTDSGQGECH